MVQAVKGVDVLVKHRECHSQAIPYDVRARRKAGVVEGVRYIHV